MNTKANKKAFPVYLIALIAIAAFALAILIGSLIAGATVEGDLTGFEKLIHFLGKETETPPAIFGSQRCLFILPYQVWRRVLGLEPQVQGFFHRFWC